MEFHEISREALIKGAAIASDAQKNMTESGVKRFDQRFTIDRNGNIAARFEPTTPMENVKKKVEELI